MFSHFFIKYASSGEEVIKKIDRAALLLLLPPAPPPSTGWMLLRFSNFSQTNLSVLVFEYKKQKAWKYHSVILYIIFGGADTLETAANPLTRFDIQGFLKELLGVGDNVADLLNEWVLDPDHCQDSLWSHRKTEFTEVQNNSESPIF